jgi:hypothetical protein
MRTRPLNDGVINGVINATIALAPDARLALKKFEGFSS